MPLVSFDYVDHAYVSSGTIELPCCFNYLAAFDDDGNLMQLDAIMAVFPFDTPVRHSLKLKLYSYQFPQL